MSLFRAWMDSQEGEDSDPDEAVISLPRGPHSIPYHPKDASVYKFCLLGARATGKSAIANRLVAHTFDPIWRRTVSTQRLFWRYHDEDQVQVAVGTCCTLLSVS